MLPILFPYAEVVLYHQSPINWCQESRKDQYRKVRIVPWRRGG